MNGEEARGPVLTTPRMVVRTAGSGDVPAIVRFHAENREHLALSLPGAGPELLVPAFWTVQVETSRLEMERDEAVRFFLFPREDEERVVGMASLTAITRGVSQTCSLGYGIAATEQGKGLMGEAVGAVVDFAFRTLGLHRVTAAYLPHNRRSGALLKRLGFAVEGYARDYLYVDGKWEDHVLTALLNPRWKPRPEKS